jgi:hypothetical protein
MASLKGSSQGSSLMTPVRDKLKTNTRSKSQRLPVPSFGIASAETEALTTFMAGAESCRETQLENEDWRCASDHAMAHQALQIGPVEDRSEKTANFLPTRPGRLRLGKLCTLRGAPAKCSLNTLQHPGVVFWRWRPVIWPPDLSHQPPAF